MTRENVWNKKKKVNQNLKSIVIIKEIVINKKIMLLNKKIKN